MKLLIEQLLKRQNPNIALDLSSIYKKSNLT